MQRATPRFLSLAISALVACGAPTPRHAPEPVPSPAAVAAPPVPALPDYGALVAAPDRTDADRALDAGRRPAQMLALFGMRAGDRVAELAAGAGYTAELLARAVGPTGVVYGHNTPVILERFAAEPWRERLARPTMARVVRLDRSLEDPFPADARDLDLVVMVNFYHDTYWFGTDRDRMNQAVFRALAPGGSFVVIDHSGRAGTGATEVKTLHRVEESLVRDEILRAGFRLTSESAFLRDPADARDWSVFDKARRGASDRFALKFTRP